MPLSGQTTYRVPLVLRDLVLVDMLELTGSTVATASLLQMSQPSVSRRYRALAEDLGLERQKDRPVGRRYGDTDWLVLLRRGVNRHRLACGVLRVGWPSRVGEPPTGCQWAEWVQLENQRLNHWPQLLKAELLDAVILDDTAALEKSIPTSELVIVELRRSAPQRLVLACRRDPLIMEIAARLGACFERA